MEKILKTTGYIVKVFDGDTYCIVEEKYFTLDELTKALLYCNKYNKDVEFRYDFAELFAVTNKALVRLL